MVKMTRQRGAGALISRAVRSASSKAGRTWKRGCGRRRRPHPRGAIGRASRAARTLGTGRAVRRRRRPRGSGPSGCLGFSSDAGEAAGVSVGLNASAVESEAVDEQSGGLSALAAPGSAEFVPDRRNEVEPDPSQDLDTEPTDRPCSRGVTLCHRAVAGPGLRGVRRAMWCRVVAWSRCGSSTPVKSNCERAEHLRSGDLRYHGTTRRVPVRRGLVVFEPVAGDDGW